MVFEVRLADGIVLMQLQRLAVWYAMTLSVRQALVDTFVRLGAKVSAKAITLAAGKRALCAETDLPEYPNATPTEGISRRACQIWPAGSQDRPGAGCAVNPSPLRWRRPWAW